MIAAIQYEWFPTNSLNGVRVQVTVFIRPSSEESTPADKLHQALWESLFFFFSGGWIGIFLLDLKTTSHSFSI